MVKKIWYILTAKQKRRLFGVAIITFIGNILEVVGVSIIIPFINAILTPDILMQKSYMKGIKTFFHITDSRSMIIFLTMAIILLYWVKNIYMVITYSVQYRFTFNNRRRLSEKLMQTYVKQPYLYHVEHNSAELLRNVGTDVDMFFTTILQFIHLYTNGGMCFLLLCVLFYQDKTITLSIIGCMIVFIICYNNVLKSRTRKKGEINRQVSKELQQHMLQTFQGIKEIKVMGREKYYFDTYNRLYKQMAKLNHDLQMYSIIPKPILEVICVTGLLGVIMIKVYRGVDLVHFVPTLALFAMAAFKMFPAAATITSSLNVFVANQKAVEVIYDILKATELLPVETDEKITFEREIELDNVTFKYPNTEKTILDGISLKIRKSQSTAFIGMSGGGKSTLIDLILGLLPPNEGRVCVDGVNINGHIRCWQNLIGYIPQTIYLSDESIKRNIAFGVDEKNIDESRVWKAIESAQLLDFVKGLDRGVETEIGEGGVRISGGQRQRIGIARALYNNPEILVLDEATSALDTETEKAIMETINNLRGQKTLLIIAHRLSTIKNCDRIYRISEGKIELTQVE